jgi:DNA mismatch endonuclease (patch repair protein)
MGHRFRVSYPTPGGKVDIAFPGKLIAIQIDGCFWHSCPEHGAKPKTNKAFWLRKLRDNVKRDRRQDLQLSKCGWTVLRFWEHEVEKDEMLVATGISKVISKFSKPGKAKQIKNGISGI